MTNALKTIENIKGKINPRYDMTVHHIQALLSESGTACELACDSFCFGYAQGIKAEKAAQHKRLMKRGSRQHYRCR